MTPQKEGGNLRGLHDQNGIPLGPTSKALVEVEYTTTVLRV